MKMKYRIGDVIYYDGGVYVITGFTTVLLNYMYRIDQAEFSMWISEQEIYNNGKRIKT
jgi:hypothetical protein